MPEDKMANVTPYFKRSYKKWPSLFSHTSAAGKVFEGLIKDGMKSYLKTVKFC